jgi:hypothetical protein
MSLIVLSADLQSQSGIAIGPSLQPATNAVTGAAGVARARADSEEEGTGSASWLQRAVSSHFVSFENPEATGQDFRRFFCTIFLRNLRMSIIIIDFQVAEVSMVIGGFNENETQYQNATAGLPAASGSDGSTGTGACKESGAKG